MAGNSRTSPSASPAKQRGVVGAGVRAGASASPSKQHVVVENSGAAAGTGAQQGQQQVQPQTQQLGGDGLAVSRKPCPLFRTVGERKRLRQQQVRVVFVVVRLCCPCWCSACWCASP